MKSRSKMLKGLLGGGLAFLLVLGFASRTLADEEEHECVEPPAGLVSWWPGDGNANDIVDGNNGIVGSGVTFAPGKVDQAFSFALGHTGVIVPDAPNLRITGATPTAQITIDAWIKPTMLAGGRIVDKITAGKGDGYALDNQTGKLRLTIGAISLSSTHSVPLNTFTHVAGTYDGTQMKVYINGVLDGSLGVSGPIPTSINPLRLGIDSNGKNQFVGLIDEVELFDRALRAKEIRKIFKAGSAGKCKELEEEQDDDNNQKGTKEKGKKDD